MYWGFCGFYFTGITFAGPVCPILCLPLGKSSSFADETNTTFIQKHHLMWDHAQAFSPHLTNPPPRSPSQTKAERFVTHITHRCGARSWVTLDVDPFTPGPNILGHLLRPESAGRVCRIFTKSLQLIYIPLKDASHISVEVSSLLLDYSSEVLLHPEQSNSWYFTTVDDSQQQWKLVIMHCSTFSLD